jgi:hypothetical protein
MPLARTRAVPRIGASVCFGVGVVAVLGSDDRETRHYLVASSRPLQRLQNAQLEPRGYTPRAAHVHNTLPKPRPNRGNLFIAREAGLGQPMQVNGHAAAVDVRSASLHHVAPTLDCKLARRPGSSARTRSATETCFALVGSTTQQERSGLLVCRPVTGQGPHRTPEPSRYGTLTRSAPRERLALARGWSMRSFS